MASDIKLLPCPCCGSEEVRLGKLDKGCYGNCYAWYYVMCMECCMQTTKRIEPEEVVELWNTRKPMDRIVEQLEEWRDIANYEGIYQISNKGNVRSLDRIVHPNNQYLQKGKILKPLDNGKYLFVTLRKDGIKENKYIHRLVAEHFLPNPLFYNEVNHKDEDKHNNCISNLEWCTHSYNMNYGTRNDKISKAKKAGGVE